ncbi:MAG: DUF1214 domain-containing protein [Hyphomicrobiaceae bacterium]|nr:DUF1214 domain-containing protein [Methyloceanibacter sp.]MDX2317753.1 DUF1214 domain-containing protein [Hyphomicrobiaceae bacterium]MDX2449780.1 DUF1214 domain-containing protein [Hyphomicrobiaceae bacterium]
MTIAPPDLPITDTSTHTSLWREEGSTSMRALGYFIGTFAVALILGIGSAWFMIERGSRLTTERFGPWQSWLSEGNPNADPYTRAHLARSGRLPLTSTVARYFVARTDDGGRGLSSGCEYSIVGSALNARWWSLAVYDEYGSLIANPSNRYSFNSEEAIRRADGTFRVNLSRQARPENWLPGGAGPDRDLVLLLRVYGSRDTDINGIGQVPPDRLPKIRRVRCE